MRFSSDMQDNEKNKFGESLNGQPFVRVSESVGFDIASGGIPRLPAAHYLLNGASRQMNVLGSLATPVDFSFIPSAGQVWVIESINIIFQHKGKMDANAFGSIPGGLVNGILIDYQTNGQAANLATLNDNADISGVFDPLASPISGWFDTDDKFFGKFDFRASKMILNGASDFIRFRIRDDLQLIEYLRATVKAWRVK